MIASLVLALVSALSSFAAVPTAAEVASPGGVPSEQQWLSDVADVLATAPAYVRTRAADAATGEHLALNLDVDNTAIASYFGGGPIATTLQLTRLAARHHVAILFNTARSDTHHARTLAQLKAAGYQVDGLCMRHDGETKVHSKQRCRSSYAAQGYTLIANLGNNPTDFAGQGYERAFRLPNYGGLLP